MTLTEMAARCRAEAAACCDPELVELLTRVAGVLDASRYHGPCTSCGERQAEVLGECRPCYQRHRRAGLAVEAMVTVGAGRATLAPRG